MQIEVGAILEIRKKAVSVTFSNLASSEAQSIIPTTN